MFEKAIDQLYEDYCTLLERIEKGYDMINALPNWVGEPYESYIKQRDYLIAQADKISDLLKGEANGLP